MQTDFLKIQKNLQQEISQVTHVIIKLGTNTIAPHVNDRSLEFFSRLATQIKKLQNSNKKVLVVSSGAVGLGKSFFFIHKNFTTKQFSLPEKQALASLGQSHLIDLYRKGFANQNLFPAQILVTASDFSKSISYRNLKQTIDQLLAWQAVPVINENDAVATFGLKLGDNDTLSALIASMFPNALLILLTTIDGFYMQQKKIDIISSISEEHIKVAGKPSRGGIGGMRTKLNAAKKILQSGQLMNICSGKSPDVIDSIIQGKKEGTWFYAPDISEKTNAKKRWMVHNNHPQAVVKIDEGAKRALTLKGGSLLSVGVISFTGTFKKGDLLELKDLEETSFAKGIAACNWRELEKDLETKNTKSINVIHRDNLIIIKS